MPNHLLKEKLTAITALNIFKVIETHLLITLNMSLKFGEHKTAVSQEAVQQLLRIAQATNQLILTGYQVVQVADQLLQQIHLQLLLVLHQLQLVVLFH